MILRARLRAYRRAHLDAATYHCQQAAEKVIKGFLAFHDHRLERTHDIEQLVSLSGDYEPGFASWVDTAVTLTPYATAYRYPGEIAALEPSRAEFDEALDAAKRLFGFVLSLLPDRVHPT